MRTDIAGATDGNYAATADDAGHALRVVVTAAGPGGDATATSEPTDAIAARSRPPAPPRNTSPPTIAGPRAKAPRSRSSSGRWTGDDPLRALPVAALRRAGNDCTDIHGATAIEYSRDADDVGQPCRSS